ncbi:MULTISPECIES: maleylacetate reductase [Rhodococcus]|uniref:Maleylacetate reductase n=1 Tax=Rhodococcus jostii TaxID=132919 RepID=A0ABU4CR68_RHOJO|nr:MULTISPECIES: maleylacetate reductase [Rhodococcus]NHU42243.1 maleylacetate reductase [Rhodococcus sp. A14]MDI9948918.1 maleylacetate reductase [Rhodococcus sp. IEGM 1305]MDI9978173.1 maleylacetate reductase [Rhodococcus sp. IEGM 1307]MDV6286069.1 maleylacetate reductase [Rhodococcus jostii]PBC51664.1 maleylacetate reductase [Rhodococcus sp. ACPA1]
MIEFDHTTLGQRVLFARGQAVDNIVSAVGDLSASRVLLVADSFVTSLADEMAHRVPVVARIDDVVQHVPVANGRAAVDLARLEAVDAVVCIGGGSSTGLAKFVARDTGIPIVAVPTTFAGSEATDVWGQTDGDRKTTGSDPKVLPRVVVYDAALFASLPARLAVASGLNAVAHAVDAFWAPRADPIDTALGTEGLRALVPGLRAMSENPDNLDAREATLYGAYLAAVAFASAGSALHHKICHVLGGAFGLSHADTHAVVLPYVMDFNGPAAPDAARRVSDALGGSSAARGLYDLRRDLGVVDSLSQLGMPEDGIDTAAERIIAAVPASNPRPVALADLRTLLAAAWAGDPIDEQERV